MLCCREGSALYHALKNYKNNFLKISLVCSFTQSDETPLYIASKRGYTEVVDILLSHGAQLSDTNKVCT